VLYVATVHYASPDWIDIQTRHLREQIGVPLEIWTSLEGIDDSYGDRFDRVIDQFGRHSDKLNHLAIEIAHEAAPDDLLMFLDGDAFPIADPMPLISDGLARAPLLAVRRAENLGDRQPHPCFCVTTVGTWRGLSGDWSAGYRWQNSEGRQVTDVGGNLLRQLELSDTPWVEVLRSNRKDLDPVFFGVYGDVVYHHGAGFRAQEFTRAHSAQKPRPSGSTTTPLLGAMRRAMQRRRRQAWAEEVRTRQLEHSERIYREILAGETAWLGELMGEDAPLAVQHPPG
jgi:hypothetical protein